MDSAPCTHESIQAACMFYPKALLLLLLVLGKRC